MTKTRPVVELDVIGLAAPPRTNGELVFEAPWQGRAFGMVMTLCARNVIEWSRFREHLISEIALWDNAPNARPDWGYYSCWLVAAEKVLTENELLQKKEIEALFNTFTERPHGHDHQH